MKNKKVLYGFLAGALVLGLAAPFATSFVAKADTLENGRIAWYTFDDEDLVSEVGDTNATAVVTGLSKYSGSLSYTDNRRDEDGKALHLGDYGLKLNQQNIGDDFTISLWLKPDGTLSSNQSVLLLGYHSPEQWLAIAGNANSSNVCKVWANGNGYSWGVQGTASISSTSWHHVVIEGSAETVTTYLDGQQIATGDSNAPLNGTNQDIYLGVNYWDSEFTGTIDDVMVYDRALTEGEIERIYTDKTPAQLLEEEGISVAAVKLPVGETTVVDLTIPEAALEEKPTIKYSVADTSIATVDETGTITAKEAGETTLKVTVSLGTITKTAETTITVNGLDSFLTAYYTFEDSIENQVEGGTDATAVYRPGPSNGIVAYEDAVAYGTGKDGKAIDLADYGLKLNQENLGNDYTVSFWVCPEATLAENQILIQLGYHSPEKWIAISGSATADVYQVWGNGNGLSYKYMYYPEVPQNEWSQITLTGTDGKVSAYLNGILLGTTTSNNPLNGENQDIYLGVNNWDTEFNGLIDEMKVYNVALSETEIQNQARDNYETMLQAKLEAATSYETILGDNESAEKIMYNLTLPETVSEQSIVWTSSQENLLSAAGEVLATPEADAEVTLTAQVTAGSLQASVTRSFVVKALDRAALDELISKAEAISTDSLTEASKNRLAEAIAEAKAANTFQEIDTAFAKLTKACDQLCYMDTYENPFIALEEPATETSITVGATAEIFTIPDEIVDAVTVTYASENTEVVTYEAGTIQGLQAGKTVVTATVAANFDGWQMEYSTAVEVTAATTPSTDTDAGNSSDNGNSSSGNSSSSSASSSSSSNSSSSSSNANSTTTTTTDATNGQQTTITVDQVPLADTVQTTPADTTTGKATNTNQAATSEITGKETVEEETTEKETVEIKEEEIAKEDTVEETEAISEETSEQQSEAEVSVTETEKKSPVGTIVAIIIVVICAGAGCGAYVVWKKKKK